MALMARFCMSRSRSWSWSCLLHGGPLYNGLYMGNAADVKGLEEARSMYTQPPSLTYYSTDTRDRAVPDDRAGEMISAKPSDVPIRRGGCGRGRRGLLWNNPWELVPWGRNHGGLGGLGNALEHMSGSLNRLFQNYLVPSRILGRLKEDDARYKLQYEVPGLRKEDLKITVENGFLTISGEHKEDEGEAESDDEDGWHASRYRFYHTTLMLPSDAKVDEINAELKHGVLHITIPRSEERKSDVKTIDIQ